MVRASLDPDGFWGRRVARLHDHTLPVLLERLEAHGVVDAFRRLHAGSDRPRQGLWFTDSDLYKWMEAAARAGRHDLLEPVVDAVVAAQQPDGYLHTWFGVDGRPRYRDLSSSHELYCFGHLIEAALADYAENADERLLETAVRLADHVVSEFGADDDPRTDGHPEIEVALALLGLALDERRYLEQARRFCHRVDAASLDDAWGHAVRALYLMTGMDLVATSTGDDELRRIVDHQWSRLVSTRLYVTGGVGGRWLGEMIGRPYELPAELAYAETCAAVALARLARLRDDDALVARVLHNAVLAGIGLDDETWFYSNPLAATGAPDRNPWASPFDFGAQSLLERFPPVRQPWYDVTCCPTNAARLLADVPSWFVEETGDRVVVEHLTAGTFEGDGWTMHIDTRFPWDSSARLTVTAHRPLRVAVRDLVDLRAEGRGLGIRTLAGYTVTDSLDPGTTLTLVAEAPDDVRLVEAHPRVESARGCVAVERGPLVYCAESIDNPGVDVLTVAVDGVDGWGWEPDLLGGVAVVHAPGHGAPLDDRLYRPAGTNAPGEPCRLTLVPYYVWANRGVGSMAVWLRRG